jgi:hypothetical protein
MTPEETAAFTEAAVEAVREASRQGRLTTREDVLAALAPRAAGAPLGTPDAVAPDAVAVDAGASPAACGGQANEPRTGDLSALLAGVLAGHPDIASFQGLSGQTVYHAPDLLSRTFARILDRKGSPLLLMAEEVRANSRDYPRPVPVEFFEAPPFDLTPEKIEHALRVMATDPEYQDITFTPTSTGAVYLFSTLHLERGYAAFLAQRAESLAMNP